VKKIVEFMYLIEIEMKLEMPQRWLSHANPCHLPTIQGQLSHHLTH